MKHRGDAAALLGGQHKGGSSKGDRPQLWRRRSQAQEGRPVGIPLPNTASDQLCCSHRA